MISTDAIILKTYPILEKDSVIECFSEQFGRIGVFIKYNQTKRPRFGGITSSLNNINLSAVQKKDSFYIRGATLNNDYAEIKKSYKKIALAYHFLEIITSVTEKNQENKEIFDILIRSLSSIEMISDDLLDDLKSEFYQAILLTEGITSKSHLLKYNEKKWSKMIEYYSNKEVKEI